MGERRVPIPDRDPLTWGRAERAGGDSLPVLRFAVLFYVGMGAAGALWIHLRGDPLAGTDPTAGVVGTLLWLERFLGPKPLVAIGLGVALGCLLIAVTRWLETWGPVKRLIDGFASILGRVTGPQAIALALASSLGEELLFRGAMQPWLGIWLTSAIFGACHFPLDRQFLAWPLFAFGAGVGLGYTADASGSLIAPIIAHFTVNWINLRHITRIAQRAPRVG